MNLWHDWTRWLVVWICLILAPLRVGAGDSACPCEVDEIDWKQAQQQMDKLSKLGYHPFITPLIMDNRDVIGMTREQVKVFMAWRSKYRTAIIHTMNKIIQERLLFQKIALRPDTTEEVLLAKQDEIFRLEQKVLKYQLSCRRNILDHFSEEQWDNFRFLLIENGYEID